MQPIMRASTTARTAPRRGGTTLGLGTVDGTCAPATTSHAASAPMVCADGGAAAGAGRSLSCMPRQRSCACSLVVRGMGWVRQMGWVGGDSGRGASREGGVEKRPRRGFRAGGVAGARCAIPIVGHSTRAHCAMTSSQDTSAGREVAAATIGCSDCSSGQEVARGICWHRRCATRVDNGDCAAERGVGRPLESAGLLARAIPRTPSSQDTTSPGGSMICCQGTSWPTTPGPRLPHTRPQSSSPRDAPHLSSQACALPLAMSFGVFPLLVIAASASVRVSADHLRKVC